MIILGFSCLFHDSSICVLNNGQIEFAAQEERFSRIKFDNSFPKKSIIKYLETFGRSLSDISHIVYYEKPLKKIDRQLSNYLHFSPKGLKSFKANIENLVANDFMSENFFKKKFKEIDNTFNQKIFFSQHHHSHASSAFFPSNFKESAIVTLDGIGEFNSTTISFGNDNKIEYLSNIDYPNSLGLLYSAFTYYLGFKVNSGEYKLMGLAPYGEPKYYDKIVNNLIDIKNDGSFRLDKSFFNFMTGFTMITKKFEDLFGTPPKKSNDEFNQFHKDIASSIQKVTEEIVIKICQHAYEITKSENICLAGGVALNCVANGKILKNTNFKNIWIQPASGDSGGSLGACLNLYYSHLNKKRVVTDKDSMKSSYLGTEYNNNSIKELLNNSGFKFKYINDDDLSKVIASEIEKKNAIGWFQGKMEFGPRALGNRSIIADPRDPKMQRNLNLKVKFRESFRPFAPVVMEDLCHEFFEDNHISPYMLLVSKIKEKHLKRTNNFDINETRSIVPAVTHVDYSARIQTVNKDSNRKLYNLINEFYKITNIPMLVNTSFNLRGEPIVESPMDALRCFMSNELDILVLENFVLYKLDQSEHLYLNKETTFELD
ncbi:hypothetical protein N9M32_04085 [Alphaproteobacteria bacterium]|nr:hypothetical protein [Alphaproteobacteria bacterium]